jgi:hypothetical protein
VGSRWWVRVTLVLMGGAVWTIIKYFWGHYIDIIIARGSDKVLWLEGAAGWGAVGLCA